MADPSSGVDRSSSVGPAATGGPMPAGATEPPDTIDTRDEPRGPISLFFRATALVFVAYPIVILIAKRPTPAETVLVLAGVGLFVGLLAFASRQPDGQARASLIGPVLVLLLLTVATVLVVTGQDGAFYPFYFYASTGASALLPPGRAVGLMILSGIMAGFAVYAVSHDAASGIVQGVSVTIIGVTVFSTGQVRRANRELLEARHELARLAVADERARIARDLHDSIGQSLSVITLKSELAGRLLPDQPDLAKREIQDIERVSREAMVAVRDTVGGYRRPTLEGELAAARETLAAADIAPSIETVDEGLPPIVDAVLAWTVREGITNVVRHSGAHQVRIRIGRHGSWAEATITDDGSGAIAGAGAGRADDGRGSGLTGLSERVRALGGRFEAGPVASGGFRLGVALPLEEGTS